MKIDITKTWPWVLLLLCALALLGYALLGTYVRLVADDYGYVAFGLRVGILDGILHIYQNWTGRYTTHFFIFAFAPYQPMISSLLPALYILLGLPAVYGLLGELRHWLCPQVEDQRLPRLALSAALTLIPYTMSHLEGIFWSAVAISYILPIPFVVWTISLALWLLRHPPTHASWRWRFGLAGALLVANAGYHEVYVIGQAAALLAALVAVFSLPAEKRRVLLPPLLGLMAFALLGVVLFFLAPGNYRRIGSGSLLERMGPILPALNEARVGWLHRSNLGQWVVLTLASWAMALLLIPRAGLAALLPRQLGRVAVYWSLTGLGLLVYMLLPPLLGYGAVPVRLQPPVVTTVSATLIGLALMAAVATARRGLNPSPALLRAAAAAFLLIPLFSLPYQARLLPDYQRYAAEWDRRDALIRQMVADGAQAIEVPPMPVRLGISDNEWLSPFTNWLNQDMADYYGLSAIRLNPDIAEVSVVQP